MRTASLARRVAAVSVTVGLLLITVPSLAAVTPQASSGNTVRPYLSGIAVSPGGDNASMSSSVGFEVTGLGNTQVHNLSTTVDTSNLPAGATLTIVNPFGWNCTTSTGSIVCSATGSFQTLAYGGAPVSINAYLSFDVVAAPDAAYGAGSLTVTAAADGLTGQSTTVPVAVAQPVTLTAGPETSFTGPPGSTYSSQFSVTNSGTATVHGVRLWLASDMGFDLTKRYSNCVYYLPDGSGAYCTFDNDLAPGVTYEVSEPVSATIAADHSAPFLGATEAIWVSPLDLSIYQGGDPGTSGSDGPLTLVVQGTQATAPPLTQAGLPQTDYDFAYFSDILVSVSGVNPANLAVIGSSVRSHPGNSVTIQVGLTDQGPAAATMSRSGDPLSVMTVTIPSGTTATSVPIECAPDMSGQPNQQLFGLPGYSKYDCQVYRNLAVHQSFLLPFTLQVPAGTARSYQGSVTISNPGSSSTGTAPIAITVVPDLTTVAPTGRRPTGVPSWPAQGG